MSSSILMLYLLAAQEQPSAEQVLDTGGNKQHRVSLTFDASQLLFYTVEVSGELRAGDKLGLAAVIGIGAPGGLLVTRLGAQLRYYLVGSFIHGLQVGAEVFGVGQWGRGAPGFEVGLAPFAGYKIATNLGFTFETQLGPSFSVITSGGEAAPLVGALIKVNLGWSF